MDKQEQIKELLNECLVALSNIPRDLPMEKYILAQNMVKDTYVEEIMELYW